MKKLTTIIAAVALFCATAANAQENKDEEPYNFVGVQVGAQATLTHYDIPSLITPQFAIQAGRYFNDKVGARVHIMGGKIKSGFQASRFPFLSTNMEYSFTDITGDLDLLVNLKKCSKITWYGVVGFGVNCTWGTDEFNSVISQSNGGNYYVGPVQCSDKHSSFNGRLGTGIEYKLNDMLGLNVEAQANYKNDQFNYKFNDRCDWQLALLVGLNFKLGKKAPKVAPVAEPVYATRVDTIWYDDTQYKTEPVAEQIERDIHYAICQSDPVDPAKVKEIADFVKSHKDVKVTVTGYADKGTGNAKINMGYSQQRAEAVANALRDAGVPADIMTVDWKGDTVQPYAENDANRVAITVASGMGEKKIPVVAKKFRTEEVRYQVQ